MITTYPTCRTARNRNVRHLLLSITQAASHFLQNLGMNLRVDGFGSLRLLSGWLSIDDTKQQVVDDSPYAGALGIATFYGNPVIDERSRSWSQSIRRRKGLIQT